MIKINKLSIENIEDIHRIDIDNFEDAWSKEMLIKELTNENAQYFGLFNDDELLGFCGGWFVVDEYQINKIVIDKPHQDKKLGQLFLIYIMELFKTQNIKKATIEVRESNARAIKVYTRAGFDIIGRRENYYANNGETAYIMIREFNNE